MCKDMRGARVAALMVGALLLVGCQVVPVESDEGPAEAAKPPAASAEATAAEAPAKSPAGPPAGWVLKFSDDFDRDEVGAEWDQVSGDWSAWEGWLAGRGEILCARRFAGNQRIEFDCRAKEDACDLSGLTMVGDGGLATGYFYGFGSEYNSYSKLMFEGQEVQRCEAVIEPGKVHHVVCQVEDGKLTHIVDGQTIQEHVVENPLAGDGHEMIGLYAYTWGQFDNVRVYTRPLAAPAK